jgi:hypothetical protein
MLVGLVNASLVYYMPSENLSLCLSLSLVFVHGSLSLICVCSWVMSRAVNEHS